MAFFRTLFEACDEEDLPEGFPVINAIARRAGVGGALLAYCVAVITLAVLLTVIVL